MTLFDVSVASYRPHLLHAADRAYPEANCYIDVLVELLHARGDEPLAALGCAASLDFEGDQLTFYKVPAAELRSLFGVDVHEMQPYRSLVQQAGQQIAAGRTMLVEVDAWYLPDTHATSYRREHVKTSIAPQAVDADAERLEYFHGVGLHELSGEDFRGALRVTAPPDSLPPYVDLVRFDRGERLAGEALRDASRFLLRGHLADRPAANPFSALAGFLEVAVDELATADDAAAHRLAFATARMGGSAAEIVSAQAAWLFGAAAGPAAAALSNVVDGCKVLSFRLARRRRFDVGGVLGPIASSWDDALSRLDELAG